MLMVSIAEMEMIRILWGGRIINGLLDRRGVPLNDGRSCKSISLLSGGRTYHEGISHWNTGNLSMQAGRS